MAWTLNLLVRWTPRSASAASRGQRSASGSASRHEQRARPGCAGSSTIRCASARENARAHRAGRGADRSVHEALRLVNGDVDLVIEPPEIIGDTDLESLRLWEDRWEYRV